MMLKWTLLLIALLAGCQAKPSLKIENDMTKYFEHVDASAGRMVGGTEAAPGSAPHMVALSYGYFVRSFSCGASLVTQSTVITAAHCINAAYIGPILRRSYRGNMGSNVWNEGISFGFEKEIMHPDFDWFTLKNDVALLITDRKIELSETINIIPFSFNEVEAGVQVRATGWGRTAPPPTPISQTLLELHTETISREQCAEDVAEANIKFEYEMEYDPRIELCTFHSVGHGMCNGDSGSALVRTDVGGLVGLVSWGFVCAVGGPDIFTRISAFRSFIETNAV